MSRRAGQKQPRVWRHWWSALFVCLAAAAAGLAGCARGRGETARRVVLHVADWGGASADPSMNRFQNEVMAEWQRLHPNIEIQPEHIPGSGEYVPKLLTAFVAGTEPEVMSLDASSAADFIDNDTLRDLTPFVRQDHLDLSTYYPNVLNLARRGEHLYALPADFTPMMLYYNKRLFDKAGVPYPKDGWTWEDFRQACRRLTVWPKGAPHPTRYGFLLENWMPGWITWIWQNGGDVLSPDGTHATGYLDSPATIEAVQFLADLVREHLAPSLSETQAQGADPFASGMVAMKISGHWNIVGLRASETIRMDDVGVVGLPQQKRRVTVIYESGYAITKGCRHPREAWEYVKFMSGPFVQRKKAELGIGISANRQIAEARRHANALEPVFLDNVRYGIAPWGARVESYAQVEDIGKEMMEEVLVGRVPVPQALHAAARRVDAELGVQ
ncbi:MAG TPA: sugar ABC transporter substrate-binding protein [Chthonomonadaceae bacterium]|nr:sugar ABC transporter substrate-binding protein [Chthonomonadaceae bacterium]